MATPGFQELSESRIKIFFYVRRDLYVATRPKTISFPPSHGDLHFKYSFAFKTQYPENRRPLHNVYFVQTAP